MKLKKIDCAGTDAGPCSKKRRFFQRAANQSRCPECLKEQRKIQAGRKAEGGAIIVLREQTQKRAREAFVAEKLPGAGIVGAMRVFEVMQRIAS